MTSPLDGLWERIPPIALPRHPVVISTRIRLARNLAGIPFKRSLDADQQRALVDTLSQATCTSLAERAHMHCKLHEVDHLEHQALVERHLISPALAASPRPTACTVTDDEAATMMINEEDHLRLQVITPGLDLTGALELAISLDQALERQVEWAVHERFGYLTACPTNTGTGMRASIMLHLPALSRTDELASAFRGLGQLHMTVRGLYGEGSEAIGNYYQISNQRTLGLSEEEIIGQLGEVVEVVIDHERLAREALLDRHRSEIDDQIHRAIGCLANARLLTSHEVCEQCNWLRLGMDLGLIDRALLPGMLAVESQSKTAHLRLTHGDAEQPEQRKQLRARLFRNWIASWPSTN